MLPPIPGDTITGGRGHAMGSMATGDLGGRGRTRPGSGPGDRSGSSRCVEAQGRGLPRGRRVSSGSAEQDRALPDTEERLEGSKAEAKHRDDEPFVLMRPVVAVRGHVGRRQSRPAKSQGAQAGLRIGAQTLIDYA